MPCQCAESWATTLAAKEKGLTWRSACKHDADLVSAFVAKGGANYPSIDDFAREDLVNHAGDRYSNTYLLVDSAGNLLAFASNSMGIVRLTSQELMGRNMEPVPEVPAMFLHRLGVLHTHKERGLGRLCVLRVFEALRHVCAHTAAACVALYVAPENAQALSLYNKLGFQLVEHANTKKDLHLMILGYPEAVEHVSQFERALKISA